MLKSILKLIYNQCSDFKIDVIGVDSLVFTEQHPQKPKKQKKQKIVTSEELKAKCLYLFRKTISHKRSSNN